MPWADAKEGHPAPYSPMGSWQLTPVHGGGAGLPRMEPLSTNLVMEPPPRPPPPPGLMGRGVPMGGRVLADLSHIDSSP